MDITQQINKYSAILEQYNDIMDGAKKLEFYYKQTGINWNDDIQLFSTLMDYHTLGKIRSTKLSGLILNFNEISELEEKITEKSKIEVIELIKKTISKEFIKAVYEEKTQKNN